METFLTEVARTLLAEHPDDLDRVTVIFNNRRSGLFLRRQFAALQEKPFFLPKIMGLDDLIAELGGLELVPNEFLLFELYDIHRHMPEVGRRFETFEEFISFGDMMMADFSEIDLYCVDVEQLFSNLHDLKAIGEWDVETGKLTPFQEQYIAFYKSLYQYYSQLHQRLLSQGKAYSGMAYRHVAENIERLGEAVEAKEVCFVGFNALSTSEHTIIRHFTRRGMGRLITDGDTYYVEDTAQEAGRFLRRHREGDIPVRKDYPSHFDQGKKNITIVSCPESVMQCKYAGQLMAEQMCNHPDQKMEQTALVLADETLLLPALNALPEGVQTANVTMGYPFTNTSVHALMLKLLSLQQHRKGAYFHHSDILDVLADTNVSAAIGGKNLYARLNQLLYDSHIIYANQDEIGELGKQLGCDTEPIAHIFGTEEMQPDEFLAQVRRLIGTLHGTDALSTNNKEKEALGCLLEIVDYFVDLQEKYHFVESLGVLQKIYTRLAQKRSVAFYGEPLSGLQVLGVLETRNLDFKRVYLLSANEGTLPAGRSNNTLIPYSLKQAFGIPTFHEKDAVYAYNFYHLIQRAEEVYLFYSTETDGTGKGLPSRFILQVERELAERYADHIELREEVLTAENTRAIEPMVLSMPKDDFALKRLAEMADTGFSPSALNKYRNCPLKFYYDNVLGIRENDQPNEDMEQNELGTHIHAVLQAIYTQGMGEPLQASQLQVALDNIDQLLRDEFEKDFQHGRSHVGRNHFFESVAKTQVSNFLKNEIARINKGEEVTIVGLEKPLAHKIRMASERGGMEVTIKGIADRIDICNGITRVLDYKSGKVEPKDLRVNDTEPNWEKIPDKWFQVMLYTWLYEHDGGSEREHLSGIVPLSHLDTEVMMAEWAGQEYVTRQQLEAFEGMLRELVSDILNPEIAFDAKVKCKECNYCPFQETCLFDNSYATDDPDEE